MLPSVQQLVDYLESRDLLSRYQSGFRRKYSTQTVITFLTDSIRRNMDAGLLTGAIFVDFRKACDTFDHKILLDKLQLFGICGSEHLWMSDYLTDRTQSAFVGGVLSSPQQVVSGVPKVLYWARCYFYCMSLTYRTVCKLLMC